MKKFVAVTGMVCLVGLSGCVTHNDRALNTGQPPLLKGETISQWRSTQTKRISGIETTKVLQAATQTLQDLGFAITDTSSQFGVISATKERDAVEAGQVAGEVALMILAAAMGSSRAMLYDQTQQINVTVSVNKVAEGESDVRVFFDRRITNNQGNLWKSNVVKEQEIYAEFFEKLSKSAFLAENQS